jgi:predicted glycosyltransferase
VSTLRVATYAINGRGMGHLVRQLAILRWVRRITAVLDVKCECWVLTSSEADTLARREGFPAFKMPSKAMLRDAGIEPTRHLRLMRAWVLNTLAGLAPDLLLVDTFPGGSFGELVAALELAKHRVLVARRVREQFAQEDPYRGLLPLYEHQIAPDERGSGPILIRERAELLSRDAARRALGVEGERRSVYVTLGGGGDAAAAAVLPQLTSELRGRGWHVVVGAGPLYEGEELRGPGITWMARYCPLELFAGLDAAASAAGYNTFHELMYAGVPTVFLPQPRIADDQLARAKRAADAGAGRIAATLAEVAELLEAPGDPERARELVPQNGARAAALAALGTVLPAADLAAASSVLTPRLLEHVGACGSGANGKALELVRILAGDTPAERARQRATLLELSERGVDVPAVPDDDGDSAPRVERFMALVSDCRAPFDTALALVRSLRRKFPAANPAELVDAAALLFPLWARFDDWMGAVSLLRAVPTQRGLPIADFAEQMASWLEHEEDLFDALRAFCHLEKTGHRTVAQVLDALVTDKAAGVAELEP